MHESEPRSLARSVTEIGRAARRKVGAEDVKGLQRMRVLAKLTEAIARGVLMFGSGPLAWILGTLTLAFHLATESQFVHSIMHGAYVGLPGAGRFTPHRYETLAVPMQCKTWGQAHAIHHARPSLLDEDPDTLHPLYRVHSEQRWRWFHRFNSFLAPLVVFEGCA